ncbi:MAG: bifunctional riboflavin kinase/FAD synthetase [Cognatishimia sp.]|uniref:bifunctional riboflavin kinase/FAD synthetase n=1 Tax=Cognatishimia sp. TaxID=2211648 RepID=UPI0040598795
MRIIRDYKFVAPEDQGATVAIGNFDGVHRGHQSVIELARAARPDAPLGIMTFEPHPRAYFAPDQSPFRLTGPDARATRLAKLGVERLYELPFNKALASLSPRAFAQEVIVNGLGLTHVVVGADFCFGQGRLGTAQDLAKLGAELGFGVTIAPLVTEADGQVSSTNIRKALSDGRPRDAAAMLGHWHRIEGPVIGGEQRGRELGYPTANMSIDGLHPPKFGVYAVLVDVLDGPHAGSYHGASSVGVRPMFGENSANIETFLFDFSGDLYGAQLSVGLVEYLRPELKFDGLEALIAQMEQDCAQCRDILSDL